ncbi:ISL3 family transposase [Arthrobacter sp. H35-MC1]|uniref:ISL3 family transposase n=1 Tax=Arthrobacter sp. H35-MC1 TaxID=3046203 RepID=UPI0024BA45D0|nr:ISL3 family transposase [Arthrobacter sp. H35-MC1]MDJ0316232.1 ISL3 family transposase [Arthrobacter sp. H35-MC1]
MAASRCTKVSSFKARSPVKDECVRTSITTGLRATSVQGHETRIHHEPRRATFSESTLEVPARARSTRRLHGALVAAVISSGRAAAETAIAHGVSWWLVQKALTTAATKLPNVDLLRPRMLGIDEHHFGAVRFFENTEINAWQRIEPWMTTIVDLDTGQILGVVDGRDHTGVGAWLIKGPLEWRLGVQVVAIDPSAAFRKALRIWLPRTAVSVDHFHLIQLANQALTEVRQALSHQVRGRRGRAVDPAWAHRMLLLRAGDSLSDQARARLEQVFATDDQTGKLKAAWDVKERVRTVLRTGSLEDAELAKEHLEYLVKEFRQPETTRLWRNICRWWKEIEVLIVTGATTGKVEANNTSIKHIKRTGRGFVNSTNYTTRIMLRSAARTAVNHP